MTMFRIGLALLVLIAPTMAVMGETPNASTAKAAPPLQSRPPDATTSSYDYWLSGNAADVKPDQTRAGMLLSGGGGHVLAAWQWFVQCADHGDIVVLSASGSDVYQDLVFKTIGGVDSVETINFKDAAAANDLHVLDIIAHADGIFMAGGKQTRYINWWKNSPVGAAINAHIRAGKPLGGSSAGLAVMGAFYYGSMAGSVTSKTALNDPFFRMVDLSGNFISAPVLDGVLMDTHFSTRQRLGRLLVFLGRIMVDAKPPRLVGLGIDEGTALCVEPDGMGKLFTEKNGNAWLVEPTHAPEVMEAGQPLVFHHVKVTGIGTGSTVNLLKREVTHPVSTRFVSAAEGKLNDDP